MDVVENAKRKLQSVVNLVKALNSGDFPHNDSRDVLKELDGILQSQFEALMNLHEDSDKDSVNTLCKAITYKIFQIYPFLGFILRSTNVRNSFELHGPFLRLVQQAFGPNAKLVISSEWEFSPFTFQKPTDLGISDSVFIGIPASETSNGLSIPLAGHEFGHNLWQYLDCEREFKKSLSNSIVEHIKTKEWNEFNKYFSDNKNIEDLNDISVISYWMPILQYGLRQCEELFCDFIGLLIFRNAYLEAFAYLLAPGLPGSRKFYYPDMRVRADYLVVIAKRYNFDTPDGYEEMFDADTPLKDGFESFLLRIADEVVKTHVEQLGDHASKIVMNNYLDHYSEDEVNIALEAFRLGVPIVDKSSLSSIVNAAWIFKKEGMQAWENRYPSIYEDDSRKSAMLSDLIYKSIEVLEIQELQQGSI